MAEFSETTLPDGQVQLRVSGPPEKVREILTAQIRRFGLPEDAFDDTIATEVAASADPVPVQFHVGGAEQYRFVAKTGLALLARAGLSAELRTPAFEPVRTYVNAGAPYPATLLGHMLSLSPFRPRSLGQFDHTVYVSASQTTGKVIVLVDLFDAFRYAVVLATAWTGPELSLVHVVDPTTGNHYTENVTVSPDLLEDVPCDRSKIPVKSWFLSLEERIKLCEVQVMVERLMGQVCQELGITSDDQELTEEQASQVVNEVSLRMAHALHKMPLQRQRPWREMRDAEQRANTKADESK